MSNSKIITEKKKEKLYCQSTGPHANKNTQFPFHPAWNENKNPALRVTGAREVWGAKRRRHKQEEGIREGVSRA